VEDDVAWLERRVKELEQGLIHASTGGELDRVRALGVEYQEAQADLERAMAEWEILGEADG
jgi:hypothetical protein